MEGKSEFDRLMREAVAIKSAQLSQYRKKFDKWPQFHQAGLYYNESYSNLRSSPLSEKIEAYESKKQQGTDFYNTQDYQQALHKYEEALTLFRWVKNRNEKWRNSGIEDADLTVETVEMNDYVIEMMVSLYLNIALCNIKLANWKEAEAACDEALGLDPYNVKAMYRKSLALTLPAGSDLSDYRTSITLLTKALQLDPTNLVVKNKLIEFKHFLADQKIKSKQTFGSFFKKPAYEDAVPEKNNNAAKEYEELISKGEDMIKDLKSHGKKQEAQKLQKNVKLMKDYKKKALIEAKKKSMDFDNPTEEMKKNAKEFGIDLDDPIVKAELKKLKSQTNLEEQDNAPKNPNETSRIKETKQRDQSYKLWIAGFIIIIFGVYLYRPTETELW
jgi:tetratricopeptide (TPR) repeat protein